MSACPVADSLVAYERQMDEDAAREAFIDERVAEESPALARRLIQHRQWLIQTLDENRDIAISVSAAVGYAIEGSYAQASSALSDALEPQAKEDAERIMAEETAEYIDKLPPKRFRDPDAAGPPEAGDIDLAKHYPEYSA